MVNANWEGITVHFIQGADKLKNLEEAVTALSQERYSTKEENE
jgi:hypothetical protein